MQNSDNTLKVLQIIRKLPKRPNVAPMAAVRDSYPYFKPQDKIMDYFKAIHKEYELNDKGEIHIDEYVRILNEENIQVGTPIITGLTKV